MHPTGMLFLFKPCTIDDRQFAIATFFDQNQMGWTNTDIFLQKIMKQKTVNDTELNQTFQTYLDRSKACKNFAVIFNFL